MTTLLQIASRVEAAGEAYISVRDFADREEWKAKFKGEMKAATREVRRILHKNEGARPSVHPALIALSIVLERDEDLGRINGSHPDQWEHEFYNASALFPPDISDLLPASADHWWESLAEAARREHSTQPPTKAPVAQRKVRLLISAPAAQPEEGNEDSPMVVDEDSEKDLNDSQSRGRPTAAKGAAATRKRKGSSAAPRGAAKRRNQSRQRPDPAEQGSGGNVGVVEESSGEIQCRRCVEGGHVCEVVPNGPCKRCKKQHQKCSLMPQNPLTGKTDRRALSTVDLLEFRRKQTEELQTEVKRGKRHARDSPDAGESEGSGLTPSPLATLSGLGGLTLDSGGSSSANTPADSPSAPPQPALPERPAPGPSSDPKTRDASKPSRKAASKLPAAAPTPNPTAVTAEAPGTSQLLRPALRQASRSRSDASPASNGGGYESRISRLERRMDEVEKWVDAFNGRLNLFGL